MGIIETPSEALGPLGAINTEPKDAATVVLKPWAYVKVAEAKFPPGAEQHAMVYLNIKGKVRSDACCGTVRVKARRRGTTDDTSFQDYTVKKKRDGTFAHLITLTWFGARPAGGVLDYYVELRDDVLSAEANTKDSDYGKGMNN